jgi:salicylate 5-hydroxylase small subunit
MDFQTYAALLRLNAEYVSVVDSLKWDQWPDFFVDDCEYKIQPRENYDRGFKLATLRFISKAMLKDRAYAISETLFHDPYYQRHVIGVPLILSVGSEHIDTETNYAIFRTKHNGPSTVFNVGKYIDRVVFEGSAMKLKRRICVFDSEMVPNSLIYPI